MPFYGQGTLAGFCVCQNTHEATRLEKAFPWSAHRGNAWRFQIEHGLLLKRRAVDRARTTAPSRRAFGPTRIEGSVRHRQKATMLILTVGSNPDRGMRFNLPIAKVPLRRMDKGYWIFQPPAAYSGDEQMLRILGRGHSVPTVTELIFVRAQRFTNFTIKSIHDLRTATGSHMFIMKR